MAAPAETRSAAASRATAAAPARCPPRCTTWCCNYPGSPCFSAAAVKIEPIGFLVVKDDGVRMINVAPPAKNGVDRIIDLVPDVMDKIESIANTNKKTD